MLPGILIALVASGTWGFSNIFARVGLHVVRPTTATLVSTFATAVVVVIGAAAINYGDLFSASAGAVLWFAFVGLVNFPLGRYFSYLGMQGLVVSKAPVGRGTAPVFTLLLAILFIDERITPVVVLGIMLIVGGLFLVVSDRE